MQRVFIENRTNYDHIRTCFVYGGGVMPGRAGGQGQVLASTMPRIQTGQQKVQQYCGDDPLCPSKYINYLWFGVYGKCLIFYDFKLDVSSMYMYCIYTYKYRPLYGAVNFDRRSAAKFNLANKLQVYATTGSANSKYWHSFIAILFYSQI